MERDLDENYELLKEIFISVHASAPNTWAQGVPVLADFEVSWFLDWLGDAYCEIKNRSLVSQHNSTFSLVSSNWWVRIEAAMIYTTANKNYHKESYHVRGGKKVIKETHLMFINRKSWLMLVLSIWFYRSNHGWQLGVHPLRIGPTARLADWEVASVTSTGWRTSLKSRGLVFWCAVQVHTCGQAYISNKKIVHLSRNPKVKVLKKLLLFCRNHVRTQDF